MSWESVKGFCRRQTQSFKEHFQHVRRTESPEFDSLVTRAKEVVTLVKHSSSRLDGLIGSLENVVKVYAQSHVDFSNAAVADLPTVGKKMELASFDIGKQHAILSESARAVLERSAKFCSDAAPTESLLNDRRSKMLELDFFRNKVEHLKAAGTSDPSRIPRNEARVEEWQKAFDESTARAARYFEQLISSGEQILFDCSGVMMVETARFFSEVSKTMRVLFQGARLTDEAASALKTAQVVSSMTKNQLATAATASSMTISSAAAAASVVQPPPNPYVPPSVSSSRRFFPADDPFRTE
jgi:hypothetical protein